MVDCPPTFHPKMNTERICMKGTLTHTCKENDIPMIKVGMGMTIPTLGHIWRWPDPPSGFAFGWVWPNMHLGGNYQTHPSVYQGNVPFPVWEHSVTMRVGTVNPCQGQPPFWVGADYWSEEQSWSELEQSQLRLRADMIRVRAVSNSSTSNHYFEIANAIVAHSYQIAQGWGPP